MRPSGDTGFLGGFECHAVDMPGRRTWETRPVRRSGDLARGASKIPERIGSCDPPSPKALRGGRSHGRIGIHLTALGLLDQRGRGLEAAAVALGELPRPSNEGGWTRPVLRVLVAVDVLKDAAGPAGEADAEDRADVRVRRGLDHTLVKALDRLERLREQHALLEVAQIDRARIVDGREGVPQAGPQAGPLPIRVLVEAAAVELPGPVELVEHAVDDLL